MKCRVMQCHDETTANIPNIHRNLAQPSSALSIHMSLCLSDH